MEKYKIFYIVYPFCEIMLCAHTKTLIHSWAYTHSHTHIITIVIWCDGWTDFNVPSSSFFVVHDKKRTKSQIEMRIAKSVYFAFHIYFFTVPLAHSGPCTFLILLIRWFAPASINKYIIFVQWNIVWLQPDKHFVYTHTRANILFESAENRTHRLHSENEMIERNSSSHLTNKLLN